MRPRLYVPAVVVAVLLGVAALAAALSRYSLDAVERQRDAPPRGASPEPAPATDAAETPPEAHADWVWTVLSILFVVLLVLIVVVLATTVLVGQRWRSTIRRRTLRSPAAGDGPAERSVAEEELLAAVDQSLATMATGSDPRAAVIACWLRLQDLAAAAGVDGRDTDTPDDLMWRLLRAHRVSEPVLTDLAEAYRRARYSPHLVDERMSRHAREALEQLRQALAGGRVEADR